MALLGHFNNPNEELSWSVRDFRFIYYFEMVELQEKLEVMASWSLLPAFLKVVLTCLVKCLKFKIAFPEDFFNTFATHLVFVSAVILGFC